MDEIALQPATCQRASIDGCILLRTLLDLSPLPMAVKDGDLVYRIANPAFCDLLGLSREEVVGRTDVDLLPAPLAESAEQWDRMALAEGVGVDFAERWPTPAGERLFEVSRHPIEVGSTGVASIAVVLTDITEARRTREQLDQYVQAVEQSPASVVITDTGGTIEYVNQRFTEVTGYAAEEAIGANPRILKSGEMAPALYAELWQTITAGREWRGELLNRKKDGSLFWEQVSISPLFDEAGQITHYLAVKSDITQAKQAEEALLAAHRANKLLIATIPSILIGVDAAGRITQWNPAAERTFGIDAKTVMGRPFVECGILWHMMEIEELVTECVERGESRRLDDVFFVRPDGREGMLGITLTPVGADGERAGFVLLASDITDRRHLESQLSQAQKLESIGQLAAGIAHEINTPTQYVGDNTRFLEEAFSDLFNLLDRFRGLLDAARAGAVSPEVVEATEAAMEDADLDYLNEEIPNAIRQSLEGIERVTQIVAAMKEFSHPGQAEKQPTDINRQIESTVTVSRNEWKYVAELTTDLDPSLPPVPCLASELNQVFLNIIVNAAHAIREVVGESGEKGRITVTTRLHGPWVEIRIADTGSGIPDHARAKVFDPFFTTKEVGKGTGQGLAIAHSVVVDKHQGTLSFETEMGKGTVFVIRLPVSGAGEGEASGR